MNLNPSQNTMFTIEDFDNLGDDFSYEKLEKMLRNTTPEVIAEINLEQFIECSSQIVELLLRYGVKITDAADMIHAIDSGSHVMLELMLAQNPSKAGESTDEVTGEVTVDTTVDMSDYITRYALQSDQPTMVQVLHDYGWLNYGLDMSIHSLRMLRTLESLNVNIRYYDTLHFAVVFEYTDSKMVDYLITRCNEQQLTEIISVSIKFDKTRYLPKLLSMVGNIDFEIIKDGLYDAVYCGYRAAIRLIKPRLSAEQLRSCMEHVKDPKTAKLLRV